MAAKMKRRGARAARVALAERWTSATRATFLDALVETASVAGATRAAGVPEGSPYRLRAKDETFSADWDKALDDAYGRLELMLLRRATLGEACDGDETPAISTTFALALLRHHHTRARRGAPDVPRAMRGASLRDKLEARLHELNRGDDIG